MAIFPQVFPFPFATPVYSFVGSGTVTPGGSAVTAYQPNSLYFIGTINFTTERLNASVIVGQ